VLPRKHKHRINPGVMGHKCMITAGLQFDHINTGKRILHEDINSTHDNFFLVKMCKNDALYEMTTGEMVILHV
ncbi:hypothetical protein, partial [Phosphitispora fastidiosa]|uniref:hypothetical protein n=1 Tax=Phosphitispora fastidiosa TaxID=2837202 RepID=UPI001E31E67A